MTVTYDATVTVQAEAKQDAERVLESFWGEFKFPVDPVTIARTLGLQVVDANLDADVAGALVKERGRDPIVLLNATDHTNRKRFTCAHEIGHYFRHRDDEFEYVDRRDTLSGTGSDSEEVYANAFAANLLMPEAEVRRLAQEDISDLEMALRFGVSRDAMNVRLAVLKIQTQ